MVDLAGDRLISGGGDGVRVWDIKYGTAHASSHTAHTY
jgi:hypothetical protein